jgi:hypothetical protein
VPHLELRASVQGPSALELALLVAHQLVKSVHVRWGISIVAHSCLVLLRVERLLTEEELLAQLCDAIACYALSRSLLVLALRFQRLLGESLSRRMHPRVEATG